MTKTGIQTITASRKERLNIVLQDRDIALLRGLFECRVMNIRHTAALYFSGRAEMAKKRLQRLKAAGLVRANARSQFEPAKLFLTEHGVTVLSSLKALAGFAPTGSLPSRTRVSDRTLDHELAVMDVKAAFHAAAPALGLQIPAFSTWPMLNQFRTERGVVKPDAFIRLRAGSTAVDEASFYLELDRSTERLDMLIERAKAYRACRRSRTCVALQTWNPTQGEHRFTVLFVLRSEARLRNFARRLLTATPPIRSLVWLTTYQSLMRDPLGAIWRRPKDIDSATAALVRMMAAADGSMKSPSK